MKVEITPLARTQCLERFSISDEQVIDTVLYRDSLEIIKFDESSKLGLYTKKSIELQSHKRASIIILVIGHFKGEELHVSSVFKIPKMIDDRQETTPLETLKRLVDHFGIELTIGRQSSKFIFKERIPVSEDHLQIVQIKKSATNFITCFFIQMEKDKKHAQCVLCFALEMDSYIASL